MTQGTLFIDIVLGRQQHSAILFAIIFFPFSVTWIYLKLYTLRIKIRADINPQPIAQKYRIHRAAARFQIRPKILCTMKLYAAVHTAEKIVKYVPN